MRDKERSKDPGPSRRSRGTRLPHLRSIREGRCLTQEQLSALSGVSRESVYRLEGGKRGAMPDTMWKLAMILGVSPAELVHERHHTWRY